MVHYICVLAGDIRSMLSAGKIEAYKCHLGL